VVAAIQYLTLDQINLSDLDFWSLPPVVREGAFKTLREQWPIPFFPEPELGIDWIPQGPGYYALTRHADVVEASRHPDLFQSGSGAVSIPDMPVVFLEFFGSMINIDDPRHARLRSIVSAGFTPKMLCKLEGDVRRAAARIVATRSSSPKGPTSSPPSSAPARPWPNWSRISASFASDNRPTI
jgi:methyl-branched lipid omega-hydroxylase